MGELITIVNLDKKEAIGLPNKFVEEMISFDGYPLLLWLLTKKHENTGFGWGDIDGYKYFGRWAGDRIAIFGNYDERLMKMEPELKYITRAVLEEVVKYLYDIGEDEMAEKYKRWLDFYKRIKSLSG